VSEQWDDFQLMPRLTDAERQAILADRTGERDAQRLATIWLRWCDPNVPPNAGTMQYAQADIQFLMERVERAAPSAPVTPPPDPLRVNDAEFLDALAAGLEAEWISNASHLVDGDIQTVGKLRAVAKRVRAAAVPEAELLAEAMYHALDEGADVSPRYAWASIQENFRDYWRAKARAVLARLSRGRTEQEG
jgi:hypothetical protein